MSGGRFQYMISWYDNLMWKVNTFLFTMPTSRCFTSTLGASVFSLGRLLWREKMAKGLQSIFAMPWERAYIGPHRVVWGETCQSGIPLVPGFEDWGRKAECVSVSPRYAICCCCCWCCSKDATVTFPSFAHRAGKRHYKRKYKVHERTIEACFRIQI